MKKMNATKIFSLNSDGKRKREQKKKKERWFGDRDENKIKRD